MCNTVYRFSWFSFQLSECVLLKVVSEVHRVNTHSVVFMWFHLKAFSQFGHKIKHVIKNNTFIFQQHQQKGMSKIFAKHMAKLRDKVRNTIEQQSDLRSNQNQNDGNRVTLSRVSNLYATVV